MVGVVELVPLELVLELDPPPPQADKMRDAVIQKNTYLLNLLFMREPFFHIFELFAEEFVNFVGGDVDQMIVMLFALESFVARSSTAEIMFGN